MSSVAVSGLMLSARSTLSAGHAAAQGLRLLADAGQAVATVVHDVQALVPAMFQGHGQQAAQASVNDWNGAMGRYHPMDVYAADIARVPGMTVIATS